MTRAGEDVNFQNIKSLNGGMRTRYKVQNRGTGNGTKTKSLKWGNEKQDANSGRSLPGDVGRSLD